MWSDRVLLQKLFLKTGLSVCLAPLTLTFPTFIIFSSASRHLALSGLSVRSTNSKFWQNSALTLTSLQLFSVTFFAVQKCVIASSKLPFLPKSIRSRFKLSKFASMDFSLTLKLSESGKLFNKSLKN